MKQPRAPAVAAPEVDFRSPSRAAVFHGLLDGMRLYKGIQVLLGEPGSGKSMLLQRLQREAPDSIRVVLCPSASLDFDQLLAFICNDLQLSLSGPDRLIKLNALKASLAAAEPSSTLVLAVDEAQALSEETLHQLLSLLRFRKQNACGLKILLSGQPGLQDKLARQRLLHPQLSRAVITRLARLSNAEALAFITYCGKRYSEAAATAIEFSAAASEHLLHEGEGVPRRLDALCQQALERAWRSKQTQVSVAMVESVMPKADATESPPVANLVEPLPPEQTTSGSKQWASIALVAGLFARPLRLATVGLGLLVCFASVAAWHLPFFDGYSDTFLQASEPQVLATEGDAIAASSTTTSTLAVDAATPTPFTVADTRPPMATPMPLARPPLRSAENAKSLALPAAEEQTVAAAELAAALVTPDVESLIAKGWSAVDNKALTTPADDNAVKWAESALEFEPQNVAAGQVLASVIDTYLAWTTRSLERGQFASATSYLRRVKSIEGYASTEQRVALNVLDREVQARQQRNVRLQAKRSSRAKIRRAHYTRTQRGTTTRTYSQSRYASTAPAWAQRFDNRMQRLGWRIDRAVGTRGSNKQKDVGYGSR